MSRTLEDEIAAFDAKRKVFERDHMHEWIVMTKGSVVGFYKELGEAFAALHAFPDEQPVLVRQIGFEPSPMPRVTFASV